MSRKVDFERFDWGAKVLSPPRPMGRTHYHAEVELNFLTRGEVTYLYQGRIQRLGAGRLAMFLGAAPHSLVAVEPGSEMVWITVPLAWVMGWRLPAAALGRLLAGDWLVAPTGCAGRFAVKAWAEELADRRRRPGRRLLLELEACVLWLTEQVPGGLDGAASSEGGLRHVEAMACHMAEHYLEPLDVAAVAAAAQLHPNYAMRVFRLRTGVTIKDYLTQLRVTHAQRLLITGDAKVMEVAMASGFETGSVFYAAFGRWVGMAPDRYRSVMRGERAEP